MDKQDYSTKIIEIIVFFDIFAHPLTFLEIHKYLGENLSPADLLTELDSLVQRGRLDTRAGFYFLRGHQDIINIRKQRFNYTNRKLKIARRFSHWLRIWPFIKLVAVSNSIGDRNLRHESDIDFFIIAAPRRLWLTRFLAAGLAKIIAQRPTSQNKRDKICLSFYLSAAQLNIDSLKLPGADPYFDYWRRNLLVIYDRGAWEKKFLAANGLGHETPLTSFASQAEEEIIVPPSNFFSGVGDMFDRSLRQLQLGIMPPGLKRAMNNSAGVVVNDQVLKFYFSDRRAEFLEKFKQKINELSH